MFKVLFILLISITISITQVEARDYNFSLSPEETQYLWEVFQKTPLAHKDSDPLMQKLQKQTNEQDKKFADEDQKTKDDLETKHTLEIVDRVLHPEKYDSETGKLKKSN